MRSGARGCGTDRAILLMERGDLHRAEKDALIAFCLYEDLGAKAAAIDAAVVLAELMLLRGDVVACLDAIDRVSRTLPPGHLCIGLDGCRAAALAKAHLIPEAAEAAQRYLETCAQAGRIEFVSLVLLDAAAVSLLSGDASAALRFAKRARRSFARRGQSVGAAMATAFCLQAQLSEGALKRSALRSGLRAAATLGAAGWKLEELRTRLVVVRVALALESQAAARRQLELTKPLGSSGTIADRIALWHCKALVRLKEGRVRDAQRALQTGLLLLDAYRAALGAVELRATASEIGTDLSQTGLRIAVDSGDPSKVLVWAERFRGNALRLPPIRPSADRQLHAKQTELRRLAGQNPAGRRRR